MVLQLLARVVGVLGVLDELVGELLLGLLRLTAELRHRTAHRLRALAEDLERWLCCLLRCGGGVLGVLLELRQDRVRVWSLRHLRRRDQRYGLDRLLRGAAELAGIVAELLRDRVVQVVEKDRAWHLARHPWN